MKIPIFSAKVPGEVFAHFHAVALEHRSSRGIDCLAWQDESFQYSPHDITENEEHAPDCTVYGSRLLQTLSQTLPGSPSQCFRYLYSTARPPSWVTFCTIVS
jgi:hypothetical protein